MADEREQAGTIAGLWQALEGLEPGSPLLLATPDGTYAVDRVALLPAEDGDGYRVVLVGTDRVELWQQT